MKKPTRSLIPAVLLAAFMAPTLAACDSLVTQYPSLAPILGPRPKASPFSLQKGHIKGRVFGASGKNQAIGLAFVTTGSISTFTANPKEGEEEAEEVDDNRAKVILKKDLDGEDGPGGEELVERILRKNPPSQSADDKYVYLRAGEFFLENVPEGITSLTASYGNVTSSPNPVTVYKNTIVEDVSLNLFIPEPLIQGPDGTIPRIVEWAGLTPINGVAVSVVTKRTTDSNGLSFIDTTVTYKPDPPDIAVTLKAPPGSPGTVLSGYQIIYEYTTPKAAREGKGQTTVGPINIPTPPIIVPPAQEIAFGPPVILQIPIGSRTLNNIFNGETDDQPGLVVATIEFRDDKGVPVPNKDLNTLKVSVPLRAL